jgi:hypothetical protein
VNKFLAMVMFLSLTQCKHTSNSAGSENKVVYGTLIGAQTYKSSGYLGTNDNGCSAVAICENILLTAAHCKNIALRSGAYFTLTAKNITSIFNRNFARVEWVDADDQSRAFSDLAMVKLASNIMPAGFRQKIQFDWSKRPKVGDVLTMVGYGDSRFKGKGGSWQQKRKGRVVVTGNKNMALRWKAGASGQIGSYGDSGGGLFNSRGELVSLESHMDDRSRYVSSGPELVAWKSWFDRITKKYCGK